MSDAVGDLSNILREPGQPHVTFSTVEREIKELVGFQLFTLLVVDGDEVVRLHTNWPAEQPIGGRKRMGPTPWGDHVLKQGRPFVGPDKVGLRWAFYDSELIESWGLGSVINIPVVYDGATIGTINILDAEHRYREEHVPLLTPFAPLLIPSFLEARRAA
jgi:transcriptional regulator with GAF, ATPase, and Fis domain